MLETVVDMPDTAEETPMAVLLIWKESNDRANLAKMLMPSASPLVRVEMRAPSIATESKIWREAQMRPPSVALCISP